MRQSTEATMQSSHPAAQRIQAVMSHLLAPSHSSAPGQSHLSPQAMAAASATPSAAAALPFSVPTPVSPTDSHLLIRRAVASDYHKGHLELLSQLTSAEPVSAEAYAERIAEMHQRSGRAYSLLVIEDTSAASPDGNGKGLIVASATLVTELKLVHGCGAAGHIEDVVVRQQGYRGKNLGAAIIRALHQVARAQGCYKVMLDCSQKNTAFYAKLGYHLSECHMRINLDK